MPSGAAPAAAAVLYRSLAAACAAVMTIASLLIVERRPRRGSWVSAHDEPAGQGEKKNLASWVNGLPPERNREAMDDDELIAAVAGGDDTALRELFARHAPWLAARLRGVLPAAEVEDVLQETFLAVWRGARDYRPEGSAGGWAWGIARRQAALWLRRRGQAELLLPALVAADGRRPGRSGGGGLGQGGPRRCCQRTGAGGRCAA